MRRRLRAGGGRTRREFRRSRRERNGGAWTPLSGFLQSAQDFLNVGEPAGLFLGEDQLPVHGDVEDAPAARGELRIQSETSFQLSRQTGGFFFVASFGAVLDLDGHDGSPPGSVSGWRAAPGAWGDSPPGPE